MLKFLKCLLICVVIVCLFFGVSAISAEQNTSTEQPTTTAPISTEAVSDGDTVVLDGSGEAKGNSPIAIALAAGFVLICFVSMIDGIVTFIRHSKKKWDDKLM